MVVRLTGDCHGWLLQGILYEDTFLQIGLQSRYSGSRGDAACSSWGTSRRLSLSVACSCCCRHPARDCRWRLGSCPAQLAPEAAGGGGEAVTGSHGREEGGGVSQLIR